MRRFGIVLGQLKRKAEGEKLKKYMHIMIIIVLCSLTAMIFNSCGRIEESADGSAQTDRETAQTDISISSPSVTVSSSNGEQASPVVTMTPNPSDPLKTYVEADEILPLIAEGSRESGEKIVELYSSDLSVAYTYKGKIEYVKVEGDLTVKGVHLGLSPKEISDMNGDALILPINGSNYSYLERLVITFNGLNGPKYAVLVPYDNYTLVALSTGKDAPITILAVYRKIKPEDIAGIFLNYTGLDAFPESLSIENIVPVQEDGWDAYHFDLVKETKTRGALVVESFCIMQYLYSIYQLVNDDMYFIGDYNHDILHFVTREEEMQSIQYNGRDIPLNDLFDVSLADSAICLKVKKTSENIYIPIPMRLFDNLCIYSGFTDFQDFLIVNPLPEQDPTLQTFRLRCLAGWDYGSSGRDLDSVNIYFDIGKMEMGFDEQTGEVLSLSVEPQYSIEQASSKKVIGIDDLAIGPFYMEMYTKELKRIADEENKEKDRLIISEDEFTIGKAEYSPNVLYLNTHSLAGCLDHFVYSGSVYQTPKEIGIGSSKEDVVNAYGPADIGYYAKDIWTYLVAIPESELAYGQRYLSSLDRGRMVLTFSEGKLVSIECIYTYGYE